MANLIQAIIVREDLKLPRGLLTAQVAHIHMETIRHLILKDVEIPKEIKDWMESPYIHVHSVPNKEWFDYYRDRVPKGVLYSLWSDTVYLSLDGKNRVPFKTAIGFSIGPCDADVIKSIIGDLPFLD